MSAWMLLLLGWAVAFSMTTVLWALQSVRSDAGTCFIAVAGEAAADPRFTGRGDDCHDCQRTTSMFESWFTRRNGKAGK